MEFLKRGNFLTYWLLGSLVFFLIAGRAIPGNDLINGNPYYRSFTLYTIQELHYHSASLYAGDLDIITSQGIVSPRVCNYVMLDLAMNCGLSYEASLFFFFVLSCLVFGLAIVTLIKLNDIQYGLFICIAAVIVIAYTKLGFFSLFPVMKTSVFINLGFALSFLAIVYALAGKINLAFLIICIASVMHIHEGIWGFVTLLIITIYQVHFSIFKRFGPYLACGVILLLTVPTLVTSSSLMDGLQYYEIIVRKGAPYHLSLLYQGVAPLMLFISYFLTLIFVHKIVETKFRNLLLIFLGVYLITIMVWYVTHELVPIKFFINLYFCKFIRYITLLFSIVLLLGIDKGLSKYGWPFFLFVLSAFFTPINLLKPAFFWGASWLPVVFILALLSILKLSKTIKTWLCIIGIVINIAISLDFIVQSKFVVLAIVTILLLANIVKEKQFEIALTCAMSLIVVGFVYKLQDTNFTKGNIFQRMVSKQLGEEIYEFGKSISQNTSKESIILGTFETNSLAYASQRVFYVNMPHACIPLTEQGIIEWDKRRDEISSFVNMDASQMLSFLNNRGIWYIAIKRNELPVGYHNCFETLEETQNYILLKRLF